MWSLLGVLLLILLVGYLGTHPELITKRSKGLIVLLGVLLVTWNYLVFFNSTT